VAFRYGGKNRGLFKNISVEDAKWIGNLLSRLTDQQIDDAFRAANYNWAEVRMLRMAVRRRINELVNLPATGIALR
jgi:ribonuclease I